MIATTLSDAKKSLDLLLDRVITQHERICIAEHGKSIAYICPASEYETDPFARHPEIMGVKIKCDLTEPVSDEDWPEDCK